MYQRNKYMYSPKSLAINRSKIKSAFTTRHACCQTVCSGSYQPINPLDHSTASVVHLAQSETYHDTVNAHHALGHKNVFHMSICSQESVSDWILIFLHKGLLGLNLNLKISYDLETKQQIRKQDPQIPSPELLYLIFFPKLASLFLYDSTVGVLHI